MAYAVVKANKGKVTHLASLTNYVNNKYYIGCGSFSSDRMRAVIEAPLEVKPENIGCKKCRAKLEGLLAEQKQEEPKEVEKDEAALLKEWGTITVQKSAK